MLKTVTKIKYDRDETPIGVFFLCRGVMKTLNLSAFFVFETTKRRSFLV